MFQAIKYDPEKNTLSILDQRLLPNHVIYEDILTVEHGWQAIATMKVSNNTLQFHHPSNQE